MYYTTTPLSSEIANLKSSTETWTFTLEDGSIVGKKVLIEDVNNINFTVNDLVYSAFEGMTWGEWVNSGFNAVGAETSGEYVYMPDDPTATAPLMNSIYDSVISVYVTTSDEIIAGRAYTA